MFLINSTVPTIDLFLAVREFSHIQLSPHAHKNTVQQCNTVFPHLIYTNAKANFSALATNSM